jgi:peptidoglycan/LPS O-acetylase OafA/YrhL
MLAFLGTFAYSVYLIHAPLLQLVWQTLIAPVALTPGAAFSALVFIGVPLAVGAAYVFFLVCERPFVRYPATTSGSSSRIVGSTTSARLSASSSGG